MCISSSLMIGSQTLTCIGLAFLFKRQRGMMSFLKRIDSRQEELDHKLNDVEGVANDAYWATENLKQTRN